jgi:hypothetical protein
VTKKTPAKKSDELRREYDFAKLERRAVGKYYARSKASPTVVLLKAEDETAPRAPVTPRPARPGNAAKKGKPVKPTTRRAKRTP